MKQLIIREFKKQDLEEVLQSIKQSFSNQFEVEGYDPEIWRKIVNRRFSIPGKVLFSVLRLLNKEPIKFFVADACGKPVGTTMVEKHGKIGYIETVMVHPDFRQKGIATDLMETAIDYLKKRKLNKAILHVLSDNHPAKNLYQKLGFRKFEDTQYLTAHIEALTNPRNISAEVRNFRKSDLDEVYDLIRTSREPEWLSVYDFEKTDLKTSLWQQVFRIGTSKKTVVVKDAKIIGYATSVFTSTRLVGRITSIEARPEMVSEGIEERLIQDGVDYLKARGSKTVLVTVPLARKRIIERLVSLGFKKSYVMEGMVLESLN